jgi:iron complex transport system permease protein
MRDATPELLVLAGIACLFLFQALLSLLQFLASPEALQQIVFWLFGSLLRASLDKVAIVALVVAISTHLLLADAWRLTALKLGDGRVRAFWGTRRRAAIAGAGGGVAADRRGRSLCRHHRLHRAGGAAYRASAGG